MFYAHIREDGKKQTVEDHLRGTAALCSKFASRFGETNRGSCLGLLHDIGKNTDAFQHRLNGGPKVDHATAGAMECARYNEMLLACCVAGHHGGLPDMGNPHVDIPGDPTLVGRLKKEKQKKAPQRHWKGTLPDCGQLPAYPDPFTYALWTRMLYSCLVDADYLDTEAFMNCARINRGGYDSLPVLLERLESYIKPWFPAKNKLNRYRCDILEQCMAVADGRQGVFSLTVPTGGGKTVASLAFALKHAVKNNMDRIIYVIPYTSIIEQTAEVFRSILGTENVLEHHSGIEMNVDEETHQKNLTLRLAAENWDAPVVVTTAVQFFESLYSNKPSRCRKLHNIANSVVIFDEAQMLPGCHLHPCVGAIANLTKYFHSTTVLCTATQPVLTDIIESFCPDLSVREIYPDTAPLYDQFRRVTYRNGGKISTVAMSQSLTAHRQVLCVVNTRKAAQRIFDGIPREGAFHLSTCMYPEHRKRILREIRRRLQAGEICRVVSTSLIEAGVDVDFPAVYREMAGLDSIIQAAGRCNREGKRPAQASIVVYFEGEEPVPLLQQINVGAAKEALSTGGDPGDPETIHRYFTAWRSLAGNQLDKTKTVEYLRRGLCGCMFPFKTVAQNFHLIDQDTYTVYIPLEEGELLCEKIMAGAANRTDFRKAGRYSVDVYEQQYRALLQAGALHTVDERSAVLTDLSLYDLHTGLAIQINSGNAMFV